MKLKAEFICAIFLKDEESATIRLCLTNTRDDLNKQEKDTVNSFIGKLEDMSEMNGEVSRLMDQKNIERMS